MNKSQVRRVYDADKAGVELSAWLTRAGLSYTEIENLKRECPELSKMLGIEAGET